jgi:uncharacterized membrane protein (UPF0127 family)
MGEAAPVALSGGMVKRDDMPRIKRRHTQAFANFLSAYGVRWKLARVKACDILDTQVALDSAKLKRIADKAKASREYAVRKLGQPLFMSSDMRLLDGHHRLAVRMALNGGDAQVPVIAVDMPIRDLVRIATAFIAKAPFPAQVPANAEIAPLSYRGVSFSVELARTPETLGKGLSNRPSLPPDHGMLFIFSEPGAHGFWMKNTNMPLSVAWLKDDGTVVALEDMEPNTLTPHAPPEPVKLALEMPRGWFKAAGVIPGSKIDVS